MPESMNVTVVTWNLGEASPSETDMTVMHSVCRFNESDLVVLGVQEVRDGRWRQARGRRRWSMVLSMPVTVCQVENLKPRRHEGSRSREWRRLTRKVLARTHILLSHTTLGGLHQAIFVRCEEGGCDRTLAGRIHA